MKTGKLRIGGRVIGKTGIADSFFLRLRGLIGRDVSALGGLLITPCSDIHTCFMSGSIDVVYLDRDMRIVAIDEAVAPWRLCCPVRGAKAVLELPPGTCVKEKIKKGDKVEIFDVMY